MDKSIERKIAHTVNGHTFPVVELLQISVGQPIPLLDIRMMSDERERELGRKHRKTFALRPAYKRCFS